MKYSKIGKKIKQYRQEKDMTQAQLADKVGVTWEMVSRYERGESSPLERINPIAEALSIDPLELLQEYYKSSSNIDRLLNLVPLFVSKPEKFTAEDTQHFYNAPLWVTKEDKGSFAVDLSIVDSEFGNKGVIYVSPHAEPGVDSLVFTEKLSIEEYTGQRHVGVVKAFERVL